MPEEKTMTVRVNPDAIVFFEGCHRRRLPHGENVTVPSTAYYLRLLHQGSIVRAALDPMTVATAAGKEGTR